ncbi:MAG: VOC family protein [Actinomycetia bacterium]|nr:VOC family protein [Actinomycetes bacterium]
MNTLNLTSIVHVNVNCSDFDRSLAFYRVLGFELLTMVPTTNTAEVAAAVGMPPYRVKGGLLKLAGESMLIDLLEWQDPASDEPPYGHLYHLGLARIALRTADLDADMAELRAAGVEFLSEPATVEWEGQPPTRFVCFRDPDGTVLELVE